MGLNWQLITSGHFWQSWTNLAPAKFLPGYLDLAGFLWIWTELAVSK